MRTNHFDISCEPGRFSYFGRRKDVQSDSVMSHIVHMYLYDIWIPLPDSIFLFI
jgi:hypothetical protein